MFVPISQPEPYVDLNMVYNVRPSGISASLYVAGSGRVILKTDDTFYVSSSETGMRRLRIDSSSEQKPGGDSLIFAEVSIDRSTAPLTCHSKIFSHIRLKTPTDPFQEVWTKLYSLLTDTIDHGYV